MLPLQLRHLLTQVKLGAEIWYATLQALFAAAEIPTLVRYYPLRDILSVSPIDISASKMAAEPGSLMAYSGDLRHVQTCIAGHYLNQGVTHAARASKARVKILCKARCSQPHHAS